VIGSLRAELSATIAKFQEDMGRAAESVRQFADKAQKQGERLSRIGTKLSLAITAPLVAFGVKSVQASVEAQRAFAQVEAALASTGNRAGRTAEQLKTSAKALETLSTFDDDQILVKVTANLLKFGNVTGDVFDKAQLAIVNLSARMGEDLESATQKVGRALNDPIQGLTALSRVGVQFTAQQQEEIKALVASGRGLQAQGMILAALEKAYGGAAKAQRDASPTAALAQSWRDLSETIGGMLVNILKPLTEILKGVADGFNALGPEMQKIVVITALFAAAVGPVLVLVGNLMKLAAALTPIITGLAAAVAGLTLATWGWVAAIGAAVLALVIFWRSIKDILHGDFEKAWADAKKTAKSMWDDMAGMFKNKPIQAPIEFTSAGTAKFKHGGPAPAAPSFGMTPEQIAARKALETDIRQMGAKISQAFDQAQLPKATAQANALNDQIDEFMKKARDAGLSTTAWSGEIAGLRDRIEGLKQVGLAKEAEKFSQAVDDDAIAVERLAKGGLDPLREALVGVDTAFLHYRNQILAHIEENAKLADSNDEAAAAMARLIVLLGDLDKAQAKATEAATAHVEAEQMIAAIQSKREVVGTQEALVNLHNARGDAGPVTKPEERLQGIARDLEAQHLDAQEKLLTLQAAREQAEMVNNQALVSQLDDQIRLQQQLADLIDKTTVTQIDAAERLQEAFSELTDNVENDLLEMLKNWDFNMKNLGQTLKKFLFDILVKPRIEATGGILKDIVSAGISAVTGSLTGGGFASVDASGTWTPGPEGFPIPGHAAGGFVPPTPRDGGRILRSFAVPRTSHSAAQVSAGRAD
jgi:hypothetical protein